MELPLAQVTPELLKSFEVIRTSDPNNPSLCHDVYGKENVPAHRPFPANAHEVRVLEIRIEGEDKFQKALALVEATLGGLPQDVRSLKE